MFPVKKLETPFKMGGKGARKRRDLMRMVNEMTSTLVSYDSRFPRARYRTSFKVRWQFAIGRTTQVGYKENGKGVCGFPIPHNFKPSIGVSSRFEERKTKPGAQKLHQKRFWEKARKLLCYLGFGEYVSSMDNHILNVNSIKRGHKIPPHNDCKDICPQITFSWNYKGSCVIRCWKDKAGVGEFVDIDTFRKVWKMDGRLKHAVLLGDDFSGTRYSCVFFKTYDEEITSEQPLFWPPVLLSEF